MVKIKKSAFTSCQWWSVPYIDETDPLIILNALAACPTWFIHRYSDIYKSKIVCVKSCKNLIPVAFVDVKDVNKKQCTRTCPSDVPNLV